MTPAMYPITLEIYYEKCDDICKHSSFYVNDRNLIKKPTISNDRDANAQHIFYNIGNSAAKTGNAVKATNDMETLTPLHNFFNKEKKEEERDSDI